MVLNVKRLILFRRLPVGLESRGGSGFYAAALMLLLLAAMGAFAPCAGAGEPARLVLQWYPQAQFAGYFVAQEKGFYAKQGLDVSILPGGADVDVPRMIEDGKADFGTMFLSTGIETRAAGHKVVNVAQIVQRSALMLVARKDSGIKTVKDLAGKRVGTWSPDFQLQPRLLFKREGIDVRVIRIAPSFDLFMRGGVDAVTAMWYNEYYTLISYGLDPSEMVQFFFSDLGLNFPEDGIYCLEATYDAHPDFVRRFVSASVEGWEYAFAHPDEALTIVLKAMKASNVRANLAHQRWMLARMRDVILPCGGSHLDLRLKPADLDRMAGALKQAGFIESAPSYEAFCRGEAR